MERFPYFGPRAFLLFFALLCLAAVAGCGGDGSEGTPPAQGTPTLAERLEEAKEFLARGEGQAARDAFQSIAADFPGSAEARFGWVLADELLFLETLDDLVTLFLDLLEPDARGKAAPIDAGAVITDTLENRLEPIVRDALEQLEICRDAPALQFHLDRLPLRLLGMEFLIPSGEYDAGDVLFYTAGFHMAAAALDTVLSANLDFDFQIVLDHAALWGEMETVEIIQDIVDMLLEILSDPQYPDFLRLGPEGVTRLPRAGLAMGAFLDYRIRGFQAVREEPVTGRRQVTGCNDRNGNNTCDPGEFIHGFLWSLPAELHDLLTEVRQALRDSFRDGTELDTAPDVPNPFTLDRLNPVLKYLGLEATLPPLPLDLGGMYAQPDPGGIRDTLRTILVLVRLLLEVLLPPPPQEKQTETTLENDPQGHRPMMNGEGSFNHTEEDAHRHSVSSYRHTEGPMGASAFGQGDQMPLIDDLPSVRTDMSATSWLPQGPPAVGWETVADIAALPYLRPTARTFQLSSHDPEGGNDDGFTPPNQLYVDEHGEFVMFDAFGPGCIYRMWFTHTWSIVANLRIYVDDMERPVIEGPFLLLFASVFEPFTAPLVGNWFSGSGGCFCYLPVPFEKRCKVTSNLPPEFFQFTWVRHGTDTPVRSLDGTEDLETLRRQWLSLGEDPKSDPPGLSSHTDTAVLAPGASAGLMDRAGPGAVWRLFLDVDPLDQEALEGLWLTARWDGHEQPDVEAPVNEFFGSYFVEDTPAGLLLGRNGQRLYCYFPMPFRTRGEIFLENRGALTAEVSWELEVTGDPYGAGAGYFRALHREEAPVAVGRDFRIADLEGRAGKWLGVTHTMRGPLSRWYLEGDERFYVDGSASPAIHGTGTEDYYNGGWYFLMGPFAEPVFGNPSHRVFPDYDQTGVFRLHLGDAVHYLNGVRLGIEHGGSNTGAADHYSSVAYFYESDTPLSRLSDTLDVGNASDESAHGYQAPGSTVTDELHSFYEGEDDEVPVSDTGRALGDESRFQASLDPENAGVVLRRRYDQLQGGQRAEVFVDGQPAGTWYTPESSPTLRWAEDDFALPASFTRDRESIEVTIRPLGPVPWTEFFYWVYSIAPP